MRSARLARLVVLTGLMLVFAVAAAEGVYPLRWGFDDIGVRGRDCWNVGCLMQHPKADHLLQEFGLTLWVTWYPDAAGTWGTEANRDYIRRLDRWCEERHITWILNQLSSLWLNAPAHCIDADGNDWYNRPDGRRFYLLPDALLQELGRCGNLLGVMYDEAEHHQSNANYVSGLDVPSIYDPAGATLMAAADGHTTAVRAVAEHHARFGVKLYTEHVLPIMFHDFARAGFVAATKVLKEAWSPVTTACAMGAAIQYGTELWITPDLWGLTGYPAHSPDEYRSALLLAYHMGADCIYTESLALDEGGKGVGSLVLMTPDDYTVTDYGRVAKAFIHEYVPSHPRRYSYRELRPRVVIIRQEDGCYGQRNIPSPWLPDRLFGSAAWQSSATTEAWLKIWHLLTRGAVSADSLYWGASSYAGRPYQVFCPLDGVVVFDHRTASQHLRYAEVIFLTGLGISPATQQAVAACVSRGATCVALPHLVPESVRTNTGLRGTWPQGKGRWVVTEDFLDADARQAVRHVIPTEDVIRYRFGDYTITLRPVDGDLNRLEAAVERHDGR